MLNILLVIIKTKVSI